MAYLAELNARSCIYGHDECRATGKPKISYDLVPVKIELRLLDYFKLMKNLFSSSDKYRWAGQNIARRGNTKGYENTKTAIKNMVMDWFIEYKDANQTFINSYHNHPLG